MPVTLEVVKTTMLETIINHVLEALRPAIEEALRASADTAFKQAINRCACALDDDASVAKVQSVKNPYGE